MIASHAADLEKAQEMDKGKDLPLNARARIASRGIGHHMTRLPTYLFTGCWGECIAQQGEPIWAYGTLFVIIEYAFFVFVSLNGGFKAPRNISICGYMELLPDWVAFMYCHVATCGIDSTLWHAATIVKKEPNMLLAIVQMVLSCLSAFTLLGFSIFPRCLWNRHQTCVLWWVYVTSFAMGVMFLRDFRKPNYTVVPGLVWAIGTFLCNYFYYESSLRQGWGKGLSPRQNLCFFFFSNSISTVTRARANNPTLHIRIIVMRPPEKRNETPAPNVNTLSFPISFPPFPPPAPWRPGFTSPRLFPSCRTSCGAAASSGNTGASSRCTTYWW